MPLRVNKVVNGQVVATKLLDDEASNRSVGLGDMAQKLFQKMGAKHCGGCEARKRLLNNIQIRRSK